MLSSEINYRTQKYEEQVLQMQSREVSEIRPDTSFTELTMTGVENF